MRVLFFAFGQLSFTASLLAAPAAADTLAVAAERSVSAFIAARGIDPGKPSERFIGFVAAKSAAGTKVEIVHRFTEDDVWIDEYVCVGGECALGDGKPRCFYVADSRLFSVGDFASAVRLTMDAALADGKASAPLKKIKYWQTGDTLYARFSRVSGGDLLFECGKVGEDVHCVEAEAVRNEP